MCRNTLRMFTSPLNFHNSAAITPFITTPAAATAIINRGSTVTGCKNLPTADTTIHTASTIRLSAFTNPASTPAR